MGLWAPKRVIHHIHLTGQKRYVTEQKWIWPVIVTGDYPKIISSPVQDSIKQWFCLSKKPANILRCHETSSEEGVQNFYTDDISLTQIWEVLLFVWGKFTSRLNQSDTIHDLGDRSLVWNFYVCSTDIILWVIQSWHHTSHRFLQWESNNVKFTEGHIWSTGCSFLSVWWSNQFDNWCGHF